MIRKEDIYYVYDTLNNRFLTIDGKMAQVNGLYASEMDSDKTSFLEFVNKDEIKKFNNNLKYGLSNRGEI